MSLHFHCTRVGRRRQRPRPTFTRSWAAALRTDRTTAGVIGTERMRTPVASKNAFAIAAAIGAEAGSPEPVEGWSLRWTTTVVTAGAVLKRMIGYEPQSRLVTPFLPIRSSS